MDYTCCLYVTLVAADGFTFGRAHVVLPFRPDVGSQLWLHEDGYDDISGPTPIDRGVYQIEDYTYDPFNRIFHVDVGLLDAEKDPESTLESLKANFGLYWAWHVDRDDPSGADHVEPARPVPPE
jgi:hypothetical protein